jgi:hypothetical protein
LVRKRRRRITAAVCGRWRPGSWAHVAFLLPVSVSRARGRVHSALTPCWLLCSMLTEPPVKPTGQMPSRANVKVPMLVLPVRPPLEESLPSPNPSLSVDLGTPRSTSAFSKVCGRRCCRCRCRCGCIPPSHRLSGRGCLFVGRADVFNAPKRIVFAAVFHIILLVKNEMGCAFFCGVAAWRGQTARVWLSGSGGSTIEGDCTAAVIGDANARLPAPATRPATRCRCAYSANGGRDSTSASAATMSASNVNGLSRGP